MPSKLNRFSRSSSTAFHLSIVLNVSMGHGRVTTCANGCCPRQHQGRVGITWNRLRGCSQQAEQTSLLCSGKWRSIQLYEYKLCYATCPQVQKINSGMLQLLVQAQQKIAFGSFPVPHHCSGPCYAVVSSSFIENIFYFKTSIFFKLCLKIQRFLAPFWGGGGDGTLTKEIHKCNQFSLHRTPAVLI